jgi:hypothetical protein
MNTDTVLGYRRPAMLGGPASPDPDALTVRWYGTSNAGGNWSTATRASPCSSRDVPPGCSKRP